MKRAYSCCGGENQPYSPLLENSQTKQDEVSAVMADTPAHTLQLLDGRRPASRTHVVIVITAVGHAPWLPPPPVGISPTHALLQEDGQRRHEEAVGPAVVHSAGHGSFSRSFDVRWRFFFSGKEGRGGGRKQTKTKGYKRGKIRKGD